MTCGVDLGEFRDGRDLPQKPRRVEPPLLERRSRPGQLGGPADLRLDLMDELADLGCRRFRLLALNADQRGFVFLIREPDLEGAVGEERDQHHRKHQSNVLEKQTNAQSHPRAYRRRDAV